MKRKIDSITIITLIILGVTCISGFVAAEALVFADSGIVDQIDVTVPAACSMISDSTDIKEVTVLNGINTADVGTTTFSATCNDVNGYAIYAIGYSNGEDGNTNLIAQSPLTATNNIATGLATSGNVSNWSMKLTAGNDGSEILNDYDEYSVVPETITKVVSKESGMNLDTSKTTFTSNYQIFISSEQPAGDYIGQVKYIMVHPSFEACPEGYSLVDNVCTAVTLTFDANGGNFDGSPINVLTYTVPEIIDYPTVTVTTSSTDSTTADGNHKTSIDDPMSYPRGADYYQDITLDTDAKGPYELTIYHGTMDKVAQYAPPMLLDYICVFDGTDFEPSNHLSCTGNPYVVMPYEHSGIHTSTYGANYDIGSNGNGQGGYVGVAKLRLNSKTARIYFSSSETSDTEVVSYGYWAEFTSIGGEQTHQELTSGTYIAEPSREGYTFLGWSTSADATSADWEYDEEDIVADSTTIYAVWVENKGFDEVFAEAGKTKLNGYYKMQDMTEEICDAVQPLKVEQSGQLIDARDNKVYWVTKLKDGNCWMSQNLDYVLNPSVALTPDDSNVSSNWIPSLATQTTRNDGWDESGVNWSGESETAPYSYRPASDVNAGAAGSRVYMEGGVIETTWTTEAECVAAGHIASDCQHWNVGTYYTWYAATAGTGNDDTKYSDATDSVCPRGWRLPSDDDLSTISSYIPNLGGRFNPYYFIAMETVDSEESHSAYGYYWSSTPFNGGVSAMYMYYNYSKTTGEYASEYDSASPYYMSRKTDGYFVRCMADGLGSGM